MWRRRPAASLRLCPPGGDNSVRWRHGMLSVPWRHRVVAGNFRDRNICEEFTSSPLDVHEIKRANAHRHRLKRANAHPDSQDNDTSRPAIYHRLLWSDRDGARRDAGGRTVRIATRGRRSDGAVALGQEEAREPELADTGGIPELSVMASGCLGLVSFPREPGRVSLERLRALYPGLLPALCRHPGIGFVLVRSEQEGAVVLGPRGTHHLEGDRVEGEDPLAPFGPNAAGHVRRTDAFPDCADLMINSAFDRRQARSRPSRSWSAPTAAWGGPSRFPSSCIRPTSSGPRWRWSAPNVSTGYFAVGSGGSDTPATRPRWTRRGKHPQLHLRRQLLHPPRELAWRIAQRPRTQAMQKPRIERPPMDGDDDLRLDQGRRARRSLGIHVSRPEPGPQPQIGSSARSIPSSERMPSKRSVSPAK